MDKLHDADKFPEVIASFQRLASEHASLAQALEQAAADPLGPVRLAAAASQPFGRLLVASRLLGEPVIEEALEEQRRTGDRVGEVLVRRGQLQVGERDALLRFQRFHRGQFPAEDVLRLGSILESQGVISHAQLEAALESQRTSGRRIGDELVAKGLCSQRHVEKALELQRRLVAALAMCIAAAACAAPQSVEAASARLSVTSNVLPRVKLESVRQVTTLSVTQRDVDRGYVEAPSASQFELRSNTLSQLTVSRHGDWFRAVKVAGLPEAMELGEQSDAQVILPASLQRFAADLSFRFELPPGAKPGTYPWPLSLSVMPV